MWGDTETFLSVDERGDLRPNAPGAWRITLFITRALTLLIVTLLVATAVALVIYASRPACDACELAGFQWVLAAFGIGLSSSIAFLLAIPSMGFAAWALAGTGIIHPHPARILVLRPFGVATLASSLRKLARRKLGVRGYCLTLIDDAYLAKKSMRDFVQAFPPLWIMSMLLPQLIPGERVRSARDLESLRRRLRKRTGFAFAALRTQANPIQIVSSDALWQEVVTEFLWSCDLIVMDLSIVNRGSAWEIDQIAQRSVLARTIFVCSDDAKAQAEARLQEIAPGAALHVYQRSGRVGRDFDQHIDEALRQRVGG